MIYPQSSHSLFGTLKVKYLHPTSAAYLMIFKYCSFERCESKPICAAEPPSRLSPQTEFP